MYLNSLSKYFHFLNKIMLLSFLTVTYSTKISVSSQSLCSFFGIFSIHSVLLEFPSLYWLIVPELLHPQCSCIHYEGTKASWKQCRMFLVGYPSLQTPLLHSSPGVCIHASFLLSLSLFILCNTCCWFTNFGDSPNPSIKPTFQP